jgi:hypothetical protein
MEAKDSDSFREAYLAKANKTKNMQSVGIEPTKTKTAYEKRVGGKQKGDEELREMKKAECYESN